MLHFYLPPPWHDSEGARLQTGIQLESYNPRQNCVSVFSSKKWHKCSTYIKGLCRLKDVPKALGITYNPEVLEQELSSQISVLNSATKTPLPTRAMSYTEMLLVWVLFVHQYDTLSLYPPACLDNDTGDILLLFSMAKFSGEDVHMALATSEHRFNEQCGQKFKA